MAAVVYACTITASCTATFNNFNEWYLHETADHEHTFDVYSCRRCWKIYPDVDVLEEHWMAKHHNEPGMLPFYGEDMLLGPTHGQQFWCGFCKSVQYTSAVDKWYDNYYSHVASHFDGTKLYARGRKNTIADWKHLPYGE
jgi:hypothetical protein